MNVFASFSIALALAYAALILLYHYGWRKLPVWKVPANYRPGVSLTVIVPARNEADRIGDCMRSILACDYPPELLEIMVVDDHSEDGTAEVVRDVCKTSIGVTPSYSDGVTPSHPVTMSCCHVDRSETSEELKKTPHVRLIRLADYLDHSSEIVSYKKKALEIAISQARGALIVTTDADCVVQPGWLRLLASVFETRPAVQMVAAPVVIHRERNLLQRFQSLDLLGLMGVTGAGIRLGFQRMGNGANLAYRKTAFEAAGGYTGNEHRASGDDMFLMQNIVRSYPDGIFFLKHLSATVFTEAPADWRGFLRQRLRWASKNAALREWPVRLVLAVVWLHCWCMVAALAAALWHPEAMLSLFVVMAGVKIAADWWYLRAMCRFFKRTDLMRAYLPSALLQWLYIVVLGTMGLLVRRYEWKGRVVR